jgi:hypothetical protein
LVSKGLIRCRQGYHRACPDTDERVTPRKQKLRKMFEDKAKVVGAEVQRLQDAKLIREVMYPVCLANNVPVKKKGSGECVWTLQI